MLSFEFGAIWRCLCTVYGIGESCVVAKSWLWIVARVTKVTEWKSVSSQESHVFVFPLYFLIRQGSYCRKGCYSRLPSQWWQNFYPISGKWIFSKPGYQDPSCPFLALFKSHHLDMLDTSLLITSGFLLGRRKNRNCFMDSRKEGLEV